jgi:hypothetical protein
MKGVFVRPETPIIKEITRNNNLAEHEHDDSKRRAIILL